LGGHGDWEFGAEEEKEGLSAGFTKLVSWWAAVVCVNGCVFGAGTGIGIGEWVDDEQLLVYDMR
jgi:hypothetical protein